MECNCKVLSVRQYQVLSLAARGYTDEVIAHQLGCNTRTVKSHFQLVYRKLEAVNRANAVAIGITNGFISLDGPLYSGSGGTVDDAKPIGV